MTDDMACMNSNGWLQVQIYRFVLESMVPIDKKNCHYQPFQELNHTIDSIVALVK